MPFFSRGSEPITLGGLQDEVNRLFERVWHAGVSTGPFDGQEWAPPVDTYEAADRYTLYIELPGVDPGAVDVSYVEGSVTLTGEKTAPPPSTEAGRLLRKERRFGAFRRSIEVARDIDPERMTARCVQGVLEITLPKAASSVARPIKVEPAE